MEGGRKVSSKNEEGEGRYHYLKKKCWQIEINLKFGGFFKLIDYYEFRYIIFLFCQVYLICSWGISIVNCVLLFLCKNILYCLYVKTLYWPINVPCSYFTCSTQQKSINSYRRLLQWIWSLALFCKTNLVYLSNCG